MDFIAQALALGCFRQWSKSQFGAMATAAMGTMIGACVLTLTYIDNDYDEGGRQEALNPVPKS
jgi:hypothetical protein